MPCISHHRSCDALFYTISTHSATMKPAEATFLRLQTAWRNWNVSHFFPLMQSIGSFINQKPEKNKQMPPKKEEKGMKDCSVGQKRWNPMPWTISSLFVGLFFHLFVCSFVWFWRVFFILFFLFNTTMVHGTNLSYQFAMFGLLVCRSVSW